MTTSPHPLPPPAQRDIYLGCGLGLSGLAFQYLCAHRTGIYLSPKMVYRAAEKVCYDVLEVRNAELVVLLPAAADPPPALNAPRYADVKFKVVSVNVNGSGGINGNLRCRGGGGRSKEEEDEGQNVVVNNNVRTSTRSLSATFWYTSPTYVPCSDPFGIA